MSWKDRLRPATFRGAEFFVEHHFAGGGRRAAVHEYPGRDIPFAEDLGRAAKQFDVDGYVLGDDYMDARDRLAAACDRAGPGSLVHPYLGQMDVLCLTYSIEEDVRDGRMARFRFRFAQAGANTYPRPAAARGAAVQDRADTGLVLVGSRFASGFSTLGALAFVVREAVTLARGGVGALLGLAMRVAGGALDPTLAALAGDFLRAPGLIGALGDAARIADTVLGVAGLIDAPDRLRAARGLLDLARTYDPGLPAIRGATPSRLLQAANRAAFVDFVHRVALIEAAALSIAAGFDSRAQAAAWRDELSDAFDGALDVASAAGDDDLFEALRALHADTVRAIDALLPRLPRLAVIVPPVSLPALALAYRVTGDATQADDLIVRNRVRHPGFVPGGEPVEVRVG